MKKPERVYDGWLSFIDIFPFLGEKGKRGESMNSGLKHRPFGVVIGAS